MPSVEAEIKAQFEQIFEVSDWSFFKRIAEFNLREAVFLKKQDVPADDDFRLLIRNIRKRLLIGVGVELLLKAIYLKQGYAINSLVDGKNGPSFPFKFSDISSDKMSTDRTAKLAALIDSLPTVLFLSDKAIVLRGLKIAKVFRNKEGHCVTERHEANPNNYVDIAASLRMLYGVAFDQELSICFSFSHGEVPLWEVSDVGPTLQTLPYALASLENMTLSG